MQHILKLKCSCFFLLLLLFASYCTSPVNYNGENFNTKGVQYLQKGEETLAIGCFNAALGERLGNKLNETDIRRNLGIAHKQRYLKDTTKFMQDRDSAKHHFLIAAKLCPNNSFKFQINMADSYLIENNLDAAIKYLENAWEIEEDNISINNVLGLFYLGENGMNYWNPSKALKFNLKVFKLNPSRLSQYVVAKNYLYLENYQAAEPFLLIYMIKIQNPPITL